VRTYAKRDDTSVAVTGGGTKMNIEQAVVANLASLAPDCRGMRGIRTVLERALDDVLRAISRDGVVDYTLGGDFGGACSPSDAPRNPRSSERHCASSRWAKAPST
jgi:predicted homoserine dehydrogenase-like protein